MAINFPVEDASSSSRQSQASAKELNRTGRFQMHSPGASLESLGTLCISHSHFKVQPHVETRGEESLPLGPQCLALPIEMQSK